MTAGFCYEVTLGVEVIIVCTLGEATDPFKDALPTVASLKIPVHLQSHLSAEILT